MKKDAIAFCLEDNEATSLDNLYYSAKSFKKQIEVILSLDTNLEDEKYKDKLFYYLVALVEGLLISKDYILLSKYVDTILKENTSTLLRQVFQATLEGNEHHISSYESLRKQVEKEVNNAS